MVSEQVTKAYKIFNAIAIISGSLVFKAAIKHSYVIGKLTLNRNNKLRNDRKYLGTSFF